MELLQLMHVLLKPRRGKLLLAVVLPFLAHVESGAAFKQRAPSERIMQGGHSFEEGVERLVAEVREMGNLRFSVIVFVGFSNHIYISV